MGGMGRPAAARTGRDKDMSGSEIEARGVAPKAFEAVALARRRGEDVDDERAVIEEDPFGRFPPLDAERPVAGRLERGLDGLGDRGILPGRTAVGDDEEVGERRDLAQVEDT